MLFLFHKRLLLCEDTNNLQNTIKTASWKIGSTAVKMYFLITKTFAYAVEALRKSVEAFY